MFWVASNLHLLPWQNFKSGPKSVIKSQINHVGVPSHSHLGACKTERGVLHAHLNATSVCRSHAPYWMQVSSTTQK